MSGFLTPSATAMNGAITAGLAQFGGVNTQAMWGAAQLGRWKWHDPDVHAQLLADNNTRLWVFSPSTLACSDPAAMIGYCDQAAGQQRDVLLSTIAGWAATTLTSTSRRAVSTTGAPGVRSSRRCPVIWSRPSNRPPQHDAANGLTGAVCRAAGTLEGVRHNEAIGRDGTFVAGLAIGSLSLVACAALVATGCSMSDDVIAGMGLPTSESAPVGSGLQSISQPPASEPALVVTSQAAGLSRRAGRGGRPAVQRAGRAEHRFLRVPGAGGQPDRSGGVGLRVAHGAR